MNLRDLVPDELPAAAALLGDTMRDNPLPRRVFGGDASTRQSALTRLFVGALRRLQRKGSVEGAFLDGHLVGLCGRMPPGHCRIGFTEKLRFFPGLLAEYPFPTAGRILSWAKALRREDPSTPHWHLGPVSVLRSHQGKGIGGALLGSFCSRMDQAGADACLETDLERNVPFYERRGFSVGLRKEVLGIPCWFMSRKGRG